jgi:hypothetical protein
MSSHNTVRMGPELMKLLRYNRLTCGQIADLLGWDASSARRWAVEFEAYGILVAEIAQRGEPARRGPLPRIYTLAPAWRGQA